MQYGGNLVGDGVQVQQIVSQRSSLLQTQLDQETQQQSKYSSYLGSMQQVQTLFQRDQRHAACRAPSTAFFNSLQQLSTEPLQHQPAGQGVLTAAQNLAQAFSSTAANLVSQQRNVDSSVTPVGEPDQFPDRADRPAERGGQQRAPARDRIPARLTTSATSSSTSSPA